MEKTDLSLNYSFPLTSTEYRGYIYFLSRVSALDKGQAASLDVIKLLYKLKDFFIRELNNEYIQLKENYIRKDFYSHFEVDYSFFVKLRKQPVKITEKLRLHIDEFVIFTLKITADYLNSIPYMDRLNNQIILINQKESKKK